MATVTTHFSAAPPISLVIGRFNQLFRWQLSPSIVSQYQPVGIIRTTMVLAMKQQIPAACTVLCLPLPHVDILSHLNTKALLFKSSIAHTWTHRTTHKNSEPGADVLFKVTNAGSNSQVDAITETASAEGRAASRQTKTLLQPKIVIASWVSLSDESEHTPGRADQLPWPITQPTSHCSVRCPQSNTSKNASTQSLMQCWGGVATRPPDHTQLTSVTAATWYCRRHRHSPHRPSAETRSHELLLAARLTLSPLWTVSFESTREMPRTKHGICQPA
jgi:hypothetical protein